MYVYVCIQMRCFKTRMDGWIDGWREGVREGGTEGGREGKGSERRMGGRRSKGK